MTANRTYDDGYDDGFAAGRLHNARKLDQAIALAERATDAAEAAYERGIQAGRRDLMQHFCLYYPDGHGGINPGRMGMCADPVIRSMLDALPGAEQKKDIGESQAGS